MSCCPTKTLELKTKPSTKASASKNLCKGALLLVVELIEHVLAVHGVPLSLVLHVGVGVDVALRAGGVNCTVHHRILGRLHHEHVEEVLQVVRPHLRSATQQLAECNTARKVAAGRIKAAAPAKSNRLAT